MADAPRARRLAKRIAAIVATELEHQVKDPRLAMATVTAATVTPDLREAVVFYTVYGTDDEVQATALALASATGVLRSAVGRQTGVRYTPTLSFKADIIPEHAQKIEELLAAARASDAAVAEKAAGASYAGDADPYRVPREDLDDGLDDDLDDDLDDVDDLDDDLDDVDDLGGDDLDDDLGADDASGDDLDDDLGGSGGSAPHASPIGGTDGSEDPTPTTPAGPTQLTPETAPSIVWS